MKLQDLKIETIERWLKDDDWRVRAAATNACNGKDVPLDIIERWLKDDDWRVRAAAMNACREKGIAVPESRTFTPPDLVYKKCIGGVIIVAEIPKDAHVRGRAGKKCRASKAKIVNVIGDFCGEKIGISCYDAETVYCVGDNVEIENFDLSTNECSTGFHFFCTEEEARKYNP